ncbi:MAG: hypothetical protein WBZ36_25330 [Candidatus Nitrosopolaris sp.]
MRTKNGIRAKYKKLLVVPDPDSETFGEVLEQLATRQRENAACSIICCAGTRVPTTTNTLPKSIKLPGEPTAQPCGVREEQGIKPNMLLT